MTTVRFQLPETIVCELVVRDHTGAKVDPSSLPTVVITDPKGTKVVNNQAMIRVSLGTYTFDYTPASTAVPGWYGVRFTVVDGGRTTIARDGFTLEL